MKSMKTDVKTVTPFPILFQCEVLFPDITIVNCQFSTFVIVGAIQSVPGNTHPGKHECMPVNELGP
jgi:hypothetical protein